MCGREMEIRGNGARRTRGRTASESHQKTPPEQTQEKVGYASRVLVFGEQRSVPPEIYNIHSNQIKVGKVGV
jgi:hypothetical protein